MLLVMVIAVKSLSLAHCDPHLDAILKRIIFLSKAKFSLRVSSTINDATRASFQIVYKLLSELPGPSIVCQRLYRRMSGFSPCILFIDDLSLRIATNFQHDRHMFARIARHFSRIVPWVEWKLSIGRRYNLEGPDQAHYCNCKGPLSDVIAWANSSSRSERKVIAVFDVRRVPALLAVCQVSLISFRPEALRVGVSV